MGELAPGSAPLRVAWGKVAASELLGLGHLDTRRVGKPEPHGQHRHTEVRSLAVTLQAPLDFGAFSLWVAMLTQTRGAHVLRMKAVISARGEPAPIAVQSVQHVVYPPLTLPVMPGLRGRSHVVVLTHGLAETDLDELRSSLQALDDVSGRAGRE